MHNSEYKEIYIIFRSFLEMRWGRGVCKVLSGMESSEYVKIKIVVELLIPKTL